MRHPTILRIMNQSHATPRTMNEYLISLHLQGLAYSLFFFRSHTLHKSPPKL